MLALSQPEEASRLLELAQRDARQRYSLYQQLASLKFGPEPAAATPAPAAPPKGGSS